MLWYNTAGTVRTHGPSWRTATLASFEVMTALLFAFRTFGVDDYGVNEFNIVPKFGFL